MTNKTLKVAMFEREHIYRVAAAMLGINAKVFKNKINHQVVNGKTAKFTDSEKEKLASEYKIKITDIE